MRLWQLCFLGPASGGYRQFGVVAGAHLTVFVKSECF